MAFGLDSTGFTKKKLSDIKSEQEQELSNFFGPIDTSPESVFGQIIGVMSEREALIWDLAERVYLSFFPQSAEGVNLDNVVDFNGLTRLVSLPSTVQVTFWGDNAATVPSGTLLEQSETGKQLEVSSDVTISKTNAAAIQISLTSVADSTTYKIDLTDTSGTDLFDYESGTGATTSSILNGLALSIQGALDSESNQKYKTTIVDDTLRIERFNASSGTQETFTAGGLANTQVDLYGTQGGAEMLTNGEIQIPINSVDVIVTSVVGLDFVTNVLPGVVGRNTETDVDLRTRRVQSLSKAGAATVPAIEAGMVQNVEVITACTVFENRTDVTVPPLPPHSIQAILTSTNEVDFLDEIAQELWNLKGGGIQTFGSSSGNAIDSQGNVQVMNFDFTQKIFIYMDLTITVYDEEIFPVDGLSQIADAIADLGNDNATSGLDVIRQRFYQAVFSIPGVQSVDYFATAGRETTPANNITDITVVTGGNYGPVEAFKLNDISGGLSAAEKGMWVSENADGTFANVITVDSDTQLTVSEDIFINSGFVYSVNEWAQKDLPISAQQIAEFDSARIRVQIT